MTRTPGQRAQDAHEDDHALTGGVDMGYEDWLTDLDEHEARHFDFIFAPFCPVTGANAAGAAPPQSAGRTTCAGAPLASVSTPPDVGQGSNDPTRRSQSEAPRA